MALSQAQLHTMRTDVTAKAELRKEGLSVVWRSWSDVARSFDSQTGDNTTDMTFFAVAPASCRPSSPYSRLGDHMFVPFPAVRAPNYFDELDVLPSADALRFVAKDTRGMAREVSQVRAVSKASD